MKTIKGLLWVIVGLMVAALGVYGISPLARLVPWSFEQKVADGLGEMSFGPECPRGSAELSRIIQRLYPIYPEDRVFGIRVHLIRGSTVNAFAALGGRIYVFEGLVKEAQSTEELAGVLAHEIEHVKRRHVFEGVMVRLLTAELFGMLGSGQMEVTPQIAKMLLELRYGRDQEHEADLGGLRRLKDSRVDVGGFQRFFERLANQGVVPALISDHPSSDERARLAASFGGGESLPVLSAGEWQALRGACR